MKVMLEIFILDSMWGPRKLELTAAEEFKKIFCYKKQFGTRFWIWKKGKKEAVCSSIRTKVTWNDWNEVEKYMPSHIVENMKNRYKNIESVNDETVWGWEGDGNLILESNPQHSDWDRLKSVNYEIKFDNGILQTLPYILTLALLTGFKLNMTKSIIENVENAKVYTEDKNNLGIAPNAWNQLTLNKSREATIPALLQLGWHVYYDQAIREYVVQPPDKKFSQVA